jgi:hypothetical protein
VRALGGALAAAIGGYVEADAAGKEAKWLAFFALPTARLCINKNEHNGRGLRRRLAIRSSPEELLRSALAEADDEEDIPGSELSPDDIAQGRTRRKKAAKERPEAPIKSRSIREAVAKTNAGFPGRACQILLRESESPSVPAIDPNTAIAKLRELHPDGHEPNPLPATVNQRRLYVSGEVVREECEKLAKAKSPGCSGWTEDLLAQALRNPTSAENFAAMLTDVLNNEVSVTVRDILVTNRLVGIPKPGTTVAVRPIAISEAALKIASSLAIKECGSFLDQLFGNLQFGLREKGCETIIHGIRGMVNADRDLCVISVDFKNAYNAVYREWIAQQLRKYPEDLGPYYSFWQFAYGKHARLRVFHGNTSTELFSRRGVRQGDPSASALFCLALHPILAQVSEEFRSLRILAYMDDVYIVGKPQLAAQAFRRIKALAKRAGLDTRDDKCKVFGAECETVAADLEINATPNCLIALNACISYDGPAESEMGKHLDSKLEHYAKFFDVIGGNIIPTEVRWQLLAACGPARWAYWARAHPYLNVKAQHIAFDKMVEATFVKIAEIASPLSNVSQVLMHLPRRVGGLGLTRYEVVGLLAYAASASTEPDAPDQESLTDELVKPLIDRLPPDAKKHVSSTRRPGASLWLQPLAVSHKPLCFALALQHRIRHFGGTIMRLRCDGCRCDLRHDQWDGHALGCTRRKGYNATHRHNRVRSAIATTLRDCGVDVSEEVAITRELRMDIVVRQDDGRELWLDLGIHATASKTGANRTVDQQGDRMESEKIRTYNQESDIQNAEFHPLILDVNCGYGSNAAKIIARLAAIAGIEAHDLMRAASFALQIGNGQIIAASRGYKARCDRQAARDRFVVGSEALLATPNASDSDDDDPKPAAGTQDLGAETLLLEAVPAAGVVSAEL